MENKTEQRSRKELLELTIGAVKCAEGEAHDQDDETFIRLCQDVIIPFLEAEIAADYGTCRVGSATDSPCQLPAAVAVNRPTPDMCFIHAMQCELDCWHGEIMTEMDHMQEALERWGKRYTLGI